MDTILDECGIQFLVREQESCGETRSRRARWPVADWWSELHLHLHFKSPRASRTSDKHERQTLIQESGNQIASIVCYLSCLASIQLSVKPQSTAAIPENTISPQVIFRRRTGTMSMLCISAGNLQFSPLIHAFPRILPSLASGNGQRCP